jgi:hypothetical protein
MSESEYNTSDSDGCEVRSEESRSGSMRDFITDDVELDPEWVPRRSTRIRKKPVRFTYDTFESEEEEEDSDDTD